MTEINQKSNLKSQRHISKIKDGYGLTLNQLEKANSKFDFYSVVLSFDF
jgi:hypothetical protein